MELEPCPFCQSIHVGQWKEGSCVVCYDCGAEGPMTADHMLSHLEPEAAWNHRAPDLAAALSDALDEVARLREALESIAELDVPRPVADAWRDDGQPSKHDHCPHSLPMYDDCPHCIADFARAALGEAR